MKIVILAILTVLATSWAQALPNRQSIPLRVDYFSQQAAVVATILADRGAIQQTNMGFTVLAVAVNKHLVCTHLLPTRHCNAVNGLLKISTRPLKDNDLIELLVATTPSAPGHGLRVKFTKPADFPFGRPLVVKRDTSVD